MGNKLVEKISVNFFSRLLLVLVFFSACHDKSVDANTEVKPLPQEGTPSIIVAGKKVGIIPLGITREKLLTLCPIKKGTDQDTNLSSNCDRNEIIWSEADYRSDGSFTIPKDGGQFIFYLVEDRLVQS